MKTHLRDPGTRAAGGLQGTLWLLLVAANLGCAPLEPAPAERPHPLIVVAVDGATWDVIDPLLEAGELPRLGALIDAGNRAELISLPPLISPVVWTTVATGRFARDHNILDHTYPYDPDAKKTAVRSTLRRAPALWNVASAHSARVIVVGYFATHPPEEINGVMVSDFASSGVKGSVFPPALEAELLAEQKRHAREEAAAIRQRYLPWPFDPTAEERPDDPYHLATKVARRRLTHQPVRDDFVGRTALSLLDEPFDLLMVYLRMPDHASHATWLYYDDGDFERTADPFTRTLLAGAIPTAYKDVDAFLGRLMAKIEGPANVVVLSDHGFGSATGPWSIPADFPEPLTGNHRPDGIFLAAGPDIAGGRSAGVTPLDVTPTLLALMGLPVSDELPGRVLEEILEPSFLELHPRRTVPSYGASWRTQPGPDPGLRAEAEALEELKALGYLSAKAEPALRALPQDADLWALDEGIQLRTLLAEALFHLMRDDVAALEALLAEARAGNPELPLLHALRDQLRTWQSSFDAPLATGPTLRELDRLLGSGRKPPLKPSS